MLFFLIQSFCFSQNIVINEFMSMNSNTILDDFGESSDWVELYNPSSQAININQWSLSDDDDELNQWNFPDTTILPNQFMLIFCSSRDTVTSYFHTCFKLDSGGEELFLTDDNGNIVDEYESESLGNNISYGRKLDGLEEKAKFYISSPGYSNGFNLEQNKVLFSHDAGYYTTGPMLSLFSENNNGQIYYTINGNQPHPDSSYTHFYSEPIVLEDIQSKLASYSYIPTTPEINPQGYFSWETPSGNVEKHVVVRARVFIENQPICHTETNTYFIDPEIFSRFSMPVLSLTTDSLGLFGNDTGIYVPGKYYVEGILKSGNYSERGDAWERKTTMEYFSIDGELLYEKDLGIRIHGNISRAAPQKALQFYPRNDYDGIDQLEFPFFDNRPFDKYKRIISRTFYSAHLNSLIRDVIMQDLAKNLNVFYQEWQPVITFINGEYWGFQILREKPNEYYLEQHFNIDTDSVDIIDLWGEVEHGDGLEHWYFLDFTDNNDLSISENYNLVKEMIDIPAYIDYYITQIFVFNKDWPGNNYTKWREKGEGKKWRWFLYDLDAAMKDVTHNSLRRAAGDTLETINPEWSTRLFKALLQNEEFADDFLSRFVYLLNNDFSPEQTIPIVDSWESIIEDEVENTILRWGILDNIEEWRSNMDGIRNFLELRPCILKNHLEEYFDVENLNIPCNSEVPDYTEYAIKIFPLPAVNTINISSLYPIQSWELYNMIGSMVKSNYNCRNITEQINISDISSGLYSLKIQDTKYQHIRKIIITK
jgi:hypothetical protein